MASGNSNPDSAQWPSGDASLLLCVLWMTATGLIASGCPTGELGFQYLILLTKDEQGELHQEKLMPMLFVPMTGDIERAR
jgi:hypothetical protein